MLKKMQKCGLVVGIMAALFIMTGCGQKAPEKTAQESAAAVETAAEETAAEEAAVVTGEAAWVFRTADGIYYWKYTAESFEETALFANYKAVPGVKNQFVFRGTDGTLVGWKEDFNMSFLEAVPAQLRANCSLGPMTAKRLYAM